MADGILGARIGRTYRDSTPGYPTERRAPEGAPNVVVVLLDDVGFANLGCYGSTIETPTMDRLAAGGLRYSRFQATPMCAPTRACLLTGRQSHAAGVGVVQEQATAFPSYYGRLSKQAATLAEVLGPSGYSCLAVGKWHLAPITDWTTAGPFDYWPLQRGFERYYGFIPAGTDQWHPDLVYGNHAIETPTRPDYHITEDFIDRSIEFIRDQTSGDAAKPFFLYLAPSACHAPLQVPKAFVEKYRGRFDAGWDAVREEWFARQQELGIVPPGTRLAPRNPGVKAWSDLSSDEQRLFARYQELFAGYLEHTDVHLGRLVSFLEEIGRLDNTVFMLLSDNGASDGGGENGYVVSTAVTRAHGDPIAEGLAALDRLGDDTTTPMYPIGWAQVSNTPFRYYKIDTYAGGTAVPLVVHWPDGIKAKGEIRGQYHHVTDIFPTLLELIGVEAPTTYDGIPQLPVHGVSMAYTFDDADAATRKEIQYFENLGHRAIWHDGWKATTKHAPGADFDDERWALFHVAEDYNEMEDLADRFPGKTREMVERWWTEAGRYGVLPLDDRGAERNRTNFNRARDRYVYLQGMAPVNSRRPPVLANRSHSITTEVDVPPTGVEGVILAVGGQLGGFALYVCDGRLVYEYNYLGIDRTRVMSTRPLSAGRHVLRVELRRVTESAVVNDKPDPNHAPGYPQDKGECTLLVDGATVGSGQIPRMDTNSVASEGINCGRDLGSPVSSSYAPPFAFTGRFGPVVIEELA